MDSRQVAKEIITKADKIKDKTIALKNDAEALLRFVLFEIKNTTGSIPDKNKFLEVVAELIDELVKLPFPFETIDSVIALKMLKGVDKAILEKWWGKDWFDKLKEKIEKI